MARARLLHLKASSSGKGTLAPPRDRAKTWCLINAQIIACYAALRGVSFDAIFGLLQACANGSAYARAALLPCWREGGPSGSEAMPLLSTANPRLSAAAPASGRQIEPQTWRMLRGRARLGVGAARGGVVACMHEGVWQSDVRC